MRHKLSMELQEVLLKRPTNHTRLATPRLTPANSKRRLALETLAGLICGVPLGISLYYLIVTVYYPVLLGLVFVGLAMGAIFHIPDAPVQGFLHSLAYGSVADVMLAVLAIVFLLHFTFGAVGQGYRVFAWVQLPLALPTALMLFYLTFMHHKPLLPFYGQ